MGRRRQQAAAPIVIIFSLALALKGLLKNDCLHLYRHASPNKTKLKAMLDILGAHVAGPFITFVSLNIDLPIIALEKRSQL